jgi:hypothetical protein
VHRLDGVGDADGERRDALAAEWLFKVVRNHVRRDEANIKHGPVLDS